MQITLHSCECDLTHSDTVVESRSHVAAMAGAGWVPLKQAKDTHNMNHGTINFPLNLKRPDIIKIIWCHEYKLQNLPKA